MEVKGLELFDMGPFKSEMPKANFSFSLLRIKDENGNKY
jgi:hypothetical protein